MNIRRATVEDSAGLAEIQVASYRTAYAGLLPESYLEEFTCEEQEQDWRELLSAEWDDVLYVAEEAGEIVGYALGRSGPCEIPPYDGELVALHVRHADQGRGIGRGLITAVAGALREAGSTKLMLWVLEHNPARVMYEQVGGLIIGEKEWGGNQDFGTAVKEIAYGWLTIEDLVAEGE